MKISFLIVPRDPKLTLKSSIVHGAIVKRKQWQLIFNDPPETRVFEQQSINLYLCDCLMANVDRLSRSWHSDCLPASRVRQSEALVHRKTD